MDAPRAASNPPVHYYERVSSTMDVIHELAGQGAKAGTAIVAGEQFQGRGSRGRRWHSPPGGLWLSVLYRPAALAGLEVTSIRVGLAVAGAIDALTEQPVELKWPNDLMIGSQKLGGVLCEARWQGDALGWIAVGVGMNIHNQIPEELLSVACSLGAGQSGISLESLAQRVVTSLRQLDLGAGTLTPLELERFGRRDWLRGKTIKQPVDGTASGLREDGALLVQPSRGGAAIPIRSGRLELAVVSHSR